MSGLVAVTALSLVLPYFFIDSSGLSKESGLYVSKFSILNTDMLGSIKTKMFLWCNSILSNLLLADWGLPANLIYSSFAVALLLCLISSYRRRDFPVLLISLMCVISMAAMIAFVKPLTRYILYLFPHFYLLLLLHRRMRPIGYIFITLVLVFSLAKLRFISNVPEPTHDKFWLYLHDQQIALPDDGTLLVSEEVNSAYFFLRKRSLHGDLTWRKILQNHGLYLQGSHDFLSKRIAMVEGWAGSSGFEFKQQYLTPIFSDENGRAIVWLYDFKPRSDSSHLTGFPP